jgi:hypothetical protein
MKLKPLLLILVLILSLSPYNVISDDFEPFSDYVTTLPAFSVEETTATIIGKLSADATTVGFHYGLTPSYGTNTTSSVYNYVYAGGGSVYKVFLYDRATMNKISETPSTGYTIYSIVDDVEYIYAGGQYGSTNGRVYQYWKTNLTKKAETANYGGIIYSIAEYGDYIYAGGDTTQKVYKYRKSDMAKVAESSSYGDIIRCLAVDSTNVYVGGDYIQKVYKYRQSDLVKIGESADCGSYIFSIALDDTYVYAGGWDSDKVYQYWKSNLTLRASSTAYGGLLYAVAEYGDYVYAGGGGYSQNRIRLYRKSDMGLQSQSNAYSGDIRSLAVDDAYVYSGDTEKYVNRFAHAPGASTYKSYGGWVYALDTGKDNSFKKELTGLSPGTLYHYRAWANTVAYGWEFGDDMYFLTKPLQPTSLSATTYNETQINLTWTKGTGANNTVIVRKTQSYPTSITDGIICYNGSSTSFEDTGLDAGRTYYYRAWSYSEWTVNPTLHQWSDEYTSDYSQTDGTRELHVGPGQDYTTIQSAIDDSDEFAYIIIHSNTYNAEYNDVTDKENRYFIGLDRDNVIITNDYDGFYLSNAHNTTIFNLTLKNNAWWGVRAPGSNDVRYENLTILFGNTDGGLQITGVRNIVRNCTITGTTKTDPGIYTYDGYDVVVNNNISGCSYGIQLYSGPGPHDGGSHFYFNNFFNNTVNAQDSGGITYGANKWYNDDLKAGNFWDDFYLPEHGAYDNNSDGRIDTPYIVPGTRGSQDLYPLAQPYNGTLPPYGKPPNLPSNVFPSDASKYVDVYTFMNITVTDDDGDPMDVSFYWSNHTLIQTLNDISNGSVASINFTENWLEHNTTYSWYVNITDGNYITNSSVFSFTTCKAWDLYPDGEINAMDVSILVTYYAYTCVAGAENWDIHEDGKCDALDVSIFVTHYGESY